MTNSAKPLSRLHAMAQLDTNSAMTDCDHAVAIVRQLLDQLTPQAGDVPPGGIPDLGGLSLYPNGVLRIEVDPANSTSPVVALGVLLHRLLTNRDQPGALRLLVLQASA